MEEKQLLVMRLEGVLQSWGENSKWDRRDSSLMPTKSGIVGLLGCAMGAKRNSQLLLELAQNITIAVRADRHGSKFWDYHTVTGTPLLTAKGTPRVGGNTFISPHAYLQDACFTVFIDAAPEWLNRLADALNSPKWPLYLGRKSCVPSRPIFECITNKYATMEEALSEYPLAMRASEAVMFETETFNAAAASMDRPDEIINIGRQFASRRVWRGTLKRKEAKKCT